MTSSELVIERLKRVSATVAVDASEEVPVPAGNIDIGLKGDQIMQRYLVRRIYREAEFRVIETDGTPHTGFITGFDNKCLQLSTSPINEDDHPRSVIVFWPIRRIEETGLKIDDMPFEQRTNLRSYSHALRAQCEKTLAPTDVPPRRVTPKSNGTAPAFSDQV